LPEVVSPLAAEISDTNLDAGLEQTQGLLRACSGLPTHEFLYGRELPDGGMTAVNTKGWKDEIAIGWISAALCDGSLQAFGV
jgi:hypothetical protein